MSIFMSQLPIEVSHTYLNLFFKQSWKIFYALALEILKHYESELLKMDDANYIIG